MGTTRRPDFRAYRAKEQALSCCWCEQDVTKENVAIENTKTDSVVCARCVSDAGIAVCELLGYGPEPVPAE